MCGIAGEHRREGSTPELGDLQAMAGAIVHRGPDDDGFLTRPSIGFAFRRLAIIDLEVNARDYLETCVVLVEGFERNACHHDTSD